MVPGTLLTTVYFIHIIGMGPIMAISLYLARKTCNYKCFNLLGPLLSYE